MITCVFSFTDLQKGLKSFFKEIVIELRKQLTMRLHKILPTDELVIHSPKIVPLLKQSQNHWSSLQHCLLKRKNRNISLESSDIFCLNFHWVTLSVLLKNKTFFPTQKWAYFLTRKVGANDSWQHLYRDPMWSIWRDLNYAWTMLFHAEKRHCHAWFDMGCQYVHNVMMSGCDDYVIVDWPGSSEPLGHDT